MPPRRGRPSTGKKSHVDTKAASIHSLLIVLFGCVWLWHLTPKANEQEVAQKYGWFWQYYTFLGFSLQLAQFSIALLADLFPQGSLILMSDRFSCAVMPIAVFITQFYYCLLLTGNIVDSDDVPKWVSPALHTGNFVGLVADWAFSKQQRSFSPASGVLAASINVAYMAFCYYLRLVNGDYTYAFLQKAPEPWGIIASAIILVIGVQLNFVLLRRVDRWKSKES